MMWRRLLPPARWRRNLANGLAGLVVVAVAIVGLGIDDSAVTRISTRAAGLWLPVESTGELVKVDPATGVATNRVEVTEPGVEVEVIEGGELVGVVERDEGILVTIDPALGTVRGRAPLAVPRVSEVVTDEENAWVAGDGAVARLPLDGEEPETLELPGSPTSVARAGSGVALVVDSQRIDARSGRVEAVGEPVAAMAVANVNDQLATVLPPRESVQLDDGTSTCVIGDLDESVSWSGSWSGPRVMAGAHSPTGTVIVSSLDEDRCRTFEITDPEVEAEAALTRPLVVDNFLYVANTVTGRLHIIDLDSNFERSLGLFRPGEPVDLLLHEDDVIAHEPRTFRGAVVGPGGVRQLIDKSAGRPLVAASADGSSLVVSGGDGFAVAGAPAESSDESGDSEIVFDNPVVLGADENDDVEDDPGNSLVANFAYSASRVQVGVPVVFIDESRGDPRSWTWDFGDGTSDSGRRVEHSWSSPGTYQVTLTVSRDDLSDSRAALVEVVPADVILPPVADFSFSASTVEVGETLVLDDVSEGAVEERRWDFGDGTTGSDQRVEKSWSAPGSYTVTLTVGNEAGADSASATIEVVSELRPVVAVIEATQTVVDVGEPVRLRSVSTGDVARLFWDFGDGGFDTATDVVHVFEQPGEYTVSLTVANSLGDSTDTVRITVEQVFVPPDARISTLPSIIEAGSAVTLTSLSLNNPTKLEWEFGDGSTGSGSPVTHTWDEAGTYVVTLTASNASGSDTTSVTVTVLTYLPPPIAGFTAPSPIRVGTAAEFQDTSSNGETYLWEFGDGVSATTASAVHTYSTADTVTVTLTVTNRNGTSTVSETVEVLPALPVAAFTASPVAIRTDETVFFSDTSTGAVSYAWNFGDGTSSTERSPSHTYTVTGTYTASLTVTNSIGESDTTSTTITVDPALPLLGPITAAPTPGETLSLVTFTVAPAVGSGPIIDYTWDLGDGGTATTTTGTTTYTYGAAGTYTVSVIANGALAGDVATAAIGFTVNDPAPPIVTLGSVTPASPELNETATLVAAPGVGSGPIDVYTWDFGDGTTATGATVTKAWGSLGDFTVSVTGTGPVGATSTATTTVTVVPPPPPDITTATAVPSPALTGRVVDFAATLAGTSGPVVSWLWDFGDGTTSALQNPPKTYTVADTYTVQVTATGPVTSDTVTFTLVVNHPPPLLTTSYSPSVPLAGGVVSFSAGPAAGSGPIDTYSWTFTDDGTTSALPNPTHTYPAAGTYTAQVTATGPGGTTGPINVTVVVYNPITANFTIAQPGGPGTAVVFTDTSTGAPAVSWSWNFGDGTTSTEQNPTHLYAAPGNYQITLTVTDGMGRADVRPRTFNVL